MRKPKKLERNENKIADNSVVNIIKLLLVLVYSPPITLKRIEGFTRTAKSPSVSTNLTCLLSFHLHPKKKRIYSVIFSQKHKHV